MIIRNERYAKCLLGLAQLYNATWFTTPSQSHSMIYQALGVGTGGLNPDL